MRVRILTVCMLLVVAVFSVTSCYDSTDYGQQEGNAMDYVYDRPGDEWYDGQ